MFVYMRKEYGEFLHQKGKIYSDFDQIRQEIEAETGKIAYFVRIISMIKMNIF